MTIADCRARGHYKEREDGTCPGCGQLVARSCVACGSRLLFSDRAINDGVCGSCRREAGITPMPARDP